MLGIWSWDSSHALAVGKKGLLLWWDGGSTWYFASQDTTMTVDLNSVVALDLFSAYVASQDGRIRRPTAKGWTEHFFSGGTALKDIAASSREDIWAVGNGLVVHFPE